MRRAFPIAAILLCLVNLWADPAMTQLRIQVTSPSGKPVERASVIVRFVKDRAKMKLGKRVRTTWETKTDQLGIAKIPPIPQGTIQVQIIASNFQTFGDVFDVDTDEKTIQIALKDPQPQYSAH
ncbi:MAG: carboxypeptidase-like regulatory domain-containing protein [Acidobacteriota bacterium]|nr:carboxypeptidase-like regulatory domain-containing protein [Acidobacteriota bacterium]